MRRFPAAALLVLGLIFGRTLPACAQRGSAHGGSSGHAGSAHTGSAFHGGLGSSTASHPYRSTVPYRYGNGRPGTVPRYVSRVPGGYGARQTYPSTSPYRRSPYRAPYRRGYAYGTYAWGVPWVGSYGGWLDPDFSDYPDDSGYNPGYDAGYDNSAAAQDQSYSPYLPYDQGQGYVSEAPEQGQSAPRPPYQPNAGASHAIAAPANQPTITLVYKDHRPNEQIHNFLLNGTTLSVWDQHPRDIPVDQLDLAATEQLNRDAGVDFHLPVGSR
jgi:hypothetical protein